MMDDLSIEKVEVYMVCKIKYVSLQLVNNTLIYFKIKIKYRASIFTCTNTNAENKYMNM